MGSGQGCGIKFLKFLLIFFNILFMLLGIGIIAASSYVIYQVRAGTGLDLTTEVTRQLTVLGAVFLVLGLIIFFISGLGCLGACRGNKCMLYTFAIIILLILIAQIAVAIASFVYRGDVLAQVDKELKKEYESLTMDNGTFADAIAEFQDFLMCCGYDNSSRYSVAMSSNDILANSCFPKELDPASRTVSNDAYQSCRMKFGDFLRNNYIYIGVIGIVFALLELLAVVFACCVARHEDLDKMA